MRKGRKADRREFLSRVGATWMLGKAALTHGAERSLPSKHRESPAIWIGSIRMLALFREDTSGAPRAKKWDFVSDHIEGIKFWDGQIDAVNVEELRSILSECRRRDLRIAYEKGRWPLTGDLYDLAISNEVEKLRQSARRRKEHLPGTERTRAKAVAHIYVDRGRALESYEAEEWAHKASEPEIARLKKIAAAGGLDLLEYIDLDGVILKNMFPYVFAKTQWGLTGFPEERLFQRGFATPTEFFRSFRGLVERIGAAVPESRHVHWRHLPNIHFWSYKEKVRAERKPDGTTVYHNVDFRRFEEQTQDFAEVLPLIVENKDIFRGVTTDYPYELFVRPQGKRRYTALARDVMNGGLSFCPILNAMSASASMTKWRRHVLSYCDAMLKTVKPDRLMVQSWGEHPTTEEFLRSEDETGSFFNVVKEVIMRAGRPSNTPLKGKR